MSEADLFTRCAAGDIDARNELVRIHAGLVHFLARRLARALGDSVELDELVSAGQFGLMQAVEAFDPARGIAFSTFATARVRGAMLDEMRRADPVTRTVRAQTRRLHAVRSTLGNRLGRRATTREVAAEAGVELQTVWQWEADGELRSVYTPELPFDEEPEGQGFNDEVGAVIPDLDFELDREREREVLREVIAELGTAEQRVLSMYFFEEKSLLEIAPHLGVTESGISRIRTRALRQLRTRLEQRGFARAVAA
ncbi:MAG: sigma-70 family RNA polymerase sigma factor [Gemmatimonadaceae bacterium]